MKRSLRAAVVARRKKPRSLSFSEKTEDELNTFIKYAKRKQAEYGRLYEYLQDLQNMIGMEEAKSAALKQLRFVVVNRAQMDGHFLNTVLSGSPGVGKTTLARILFNIYKCTNSLGPRGREQSFTICRRSDLVAKYLVRVCVCMMSLLYYSTLTIVLAIQGQTAKKTRKFLAKVNGVLFIDG